jgi:hypothetical protein
VRDYSVHTFCVCVSWGGEKWRGGRGGENIGEKKRVLLNINHRPFFKIQTTVQLIEKY